MHRLTHTAERTLDIIEELRDRRNSRNIHRKNIVNGSIGAGRSRRTVTPSSSDTSGSTPGALTKSDSGDSRRLSCRTAKLPLQREWTVGLNFSGLWRNRVSYLPLKERVLGSSPRRPTFCFVTLLGGGLIVYQAGRVQFPYEARRDSVGSIPTSDFGRNWSRSRMSRNWRSVLPVVWRISSTVERWILNSVT
jgi:hypothetical protein